MAQKAFDGVKLLWIFRGDKTCGTACGLHSSRPADSMDVILRAMRQIEIDHVTNIGHVDAPCRNIRRDKYLEHSAPKALQRTTAFRQTTVAMQHANSMSRTTEHTTDMIGSMLGSGEDQDGLRLPFQQRQEEIRLSDMRRIMQCLRDAVRRGCRWRHDDAHRIIDAGAETLCQIGRQRGGK